MGTPRREGDYLVDRTADPDRWWNAVYSDTALITQVDDGNAHLSTGTTPTSSCSEPGAVTAMLEQLWLADHHRVLEIGTGTGWTAALLSWRLGAQNVVTIEVDPALAEQARRNLASAGYSPQVIVGDGATGHTPGAPYDRVHATCAVQRVPWSWIEQTRPGGVVVAPYATGYAYGHLARLVVSGNGSATGKFPMSAGFMMMRSQRHADAAIRRKGKAAVSSTSLDPRTIAWESYGADLAIGERVPACRSRLDEPDGDGRRVFHLTGNDGSWARVEFAPGQRQYEVTQYGRRKLWDEVEEAYAWWVDAGRPDRDRFGMTVTASDQWIWLDRPDNRVTAGSTPRLRAG